MEDEKIKEIVNGVCWVQKKFYDYVPNRLEIEFDPKDPEYVEITVTDSNEMTAYTTVSLRQLLSAIERIKSEK